VCDTSPRFVRPYPTPAQNVVWLNVIVILGRHINELVEEKHLKIIHHYLQSKKSGIPITNYAQRNHRKLFKKVFYLNLLSGKRTNTLWAVQRSVALDECERAGEVKVEAVELLEAKKNS
jgi:hypothetical protein